MPYYISDQMTDCAGWATIKADAPDATPETIGCHELKDDAIDQMVAVSLSEGIEPMGDWAERQLIIVTDDLMPDDDTEDDDEMEERQIDLSAPQFMRDNAQRGLEYHAEGLSGDGLQPETVADARKMADGEVSIDKWRKIAPWIARHMTDLDAADGEITAGVVAHLLWGSGSTKEEAQRTMDYAQNIIDQLDEELEEEGRSAEPVRENRWVIKNADESRKQYAFTTLEVRAIDETSDDGWTVSGYAAVFDSPSEPLPWTEYVKRGAFRKTIKDGADVRLLIDHTGVPLARTKSGTLILREDDKGLYMEARLDPANPDAVKMRSALMRGDVSQMSFAFETVKDGWNKDRTVRELKEVRLHDVSIVTYPAYEETSAEMRNNQSTDTAVGTVSPISLRKAQIALARARAVR
jgi:HK97 family phage prohead protease